MMVRVIAKHIGEVEQGIYKQLYSLNFRGNGMMRKTLVASKQNNAGYVAYIIEDEFVLAWAILSKHFNGKYVLISPNTYNAHFYVRKSHRRMGLGRVLYKAIKKISKNKKLKLIKHDEVSKQFFNKVGKI
jgi:L-amino acid N-acyltransferase YncA